MKPTYFATPADFRAWLERHHESTPELWVGFYKKQTRKPSITWPESVDEALCFGWIDGRRVRLDEDSYAIRFTPRRAVSTWSAINIARVKDLTRLGRMRPTGLERFAERSDDRSAIYAYEQRRTATLDDAQEQHFRHNTKAWEFFQAQAPWYRRTATYWVGSAKKEETRKYRLAALIADSAKLRRIGPLNRPATAKTAARNATIAKTATQTAAKQSSPKRSTAQKSSARRPTPKK